jgi:Na+-driven multidrug efflux pump
VGDVTRIGLIATLTMSAVLAVLIVLADHPLLALFLGWESSALPIAEHIQLVCTGSFVIMCISMILSGTMRAYGAVLAPLVIMFVALYPARLGFYFLAYPHIGGEAVWWAYPAGSVVAATLTVAYYRSGKWRRPDAFTPAPGAPAA